MAEKPDYTRPELTVYGSIEELTNELETGAGDGITGSSLI